MNIFPVAVQSYLPDSHPIESEEIPDTHISTDTIVQLYQKVQQLRKNVVAHADRTLISTANSIAKRSLLKVEKKRASDLFESFAKSHKEKRESFSVLGELSPILSAALRGDRTYVYDAIQRKEDLAATDSSGNTALHLAFFSGDCETIRLLSRHIDPSQKNHDGRTPLAELAHSSWGGRKWISVEEKRELLSKWLRSTDRSYERIWKKIGGIFADPLLYQKDPVEFLYLLADFSVTKKSWKDLSQEEWDRSCRELEAKYPHKSVGAFYGSSFSWNDAHFHTGVTVFSPTLSQQCSLSDFEEQLCALLDEDDFDACAMAQKVGVFEKPQSQNEETSRVEAIKELATLIQTFIGRIQNKVVFSGTPREGTEALRVFYSTMERFLLQVYGALQEKGDRKVWLYVTKKILKAASYCAPHYFYVAHDLYVSVCTDEKISSLARLQGCIAQYRKLCLEESVGLLFPEEEHNIHGYTRAVREMGERLGILGREDFLVFTDKYQVPGYSQEAIEGKFFELYTPNHLVYDWLLPQFAGDQALQDHYRKLQKRYLPKDWKKETYQKIYQKVAVKQKQGPSSVKEYLESKEIFQRKHQSIEEAIEQDRAYCYLSEEVYEPSGQIRSQAFFQLFERLDIFHSHLCKNSSFFR